MYRKTKLKGALLCPLPTVAYNMVTNPGLVMHHGHALLTDASP